MYSYVYIVYSLYGARHETTSPHMYGARHETTSPHMYGEKEK